MKKIFLFLSDRAKGFARQRSSWGDRTKLGVNLGITGVGLIKHPTAQLTAISLGIAETAGAFDGLYDYADATEKSGILIVPGIYSPMPFIFKIK